MYFALLGNPVIMLIKKMKAPSPLVLNNIFIGFLKIFPRTFGMSISTRIDDIMNMGNNDGMMFFRKRLLLKVIVWLRVFEFRNIFIMVISRVIIIVKEYNFFFIFHLISCYNYIGEMIMKNDMIRNFKDKIRQFFKNPKEVISFFLPIVITLCLLIPVPYYIKLGGGTIKLNDKINIKGEASSDGSLEALYVKESKGIVFTYLLSYVVPSFDKEKIEDVYIDNEDDDSYNYREKLYFTTSLDAATKVAFEKAGKEVDIASSKFLVIYIDKDSKSNLRVGDQILKINGNSVKSYEEINKYVSSDKGKKSVSITVKRDGKVITTDNSLMMIDGEPKLGIVVSNEISYKSNPEVDFDFNGKQAGPSGGLMIALTIYNKLVSYDITGGKRVVGTGTIDLKGNVGEIGGVKHKLMAASNRKADIVFVPKDNYKEAKKIKDDKGYNFELVGVSTFDEAVEYLENN